MRGHGVVVTVVGSVLSAIIVAVLAGAGVFDTAESVGDGIAHRGTTAPNASTAPAVASEGPVPGGPVLVDVAEAVDLVDAYSKAAGRRDYDTAYAALSPARQVKWRRDDFESFWNGIARTGFFPDDQPSVEKALWRDDGAAVITVLLFFDECAKQTRSVEHVTFHVERHGDALRLGDYSPEQDFELTGDPVPPDVLANNCPSA